MITGNSECESFTTGPFWSFFDQLSHERSLGSLGPHPRLQLGRRPVFTRLIMPKTKMTDVPRETPLANPPPFVGKSNL